MSFWDHLDVLRGTIFRSVLAITVFSVAVFCFKRLVFDGIVLAPARSDFCVYRWLGMEMRMTLVNLEITTQFFVHLKVAFAGFHLGFSLHTFEIWKFIAPALYENKSAPSVRCSLSQSSSTSDCRRLLSDRTDLSAFLSQLYRQRYHQNTISLQSYISFTSTLLAFGIFEFRLRSPSCRVSIITADVIKYRHTPS